MQMRLWMVGILCLLASEPSILWGQSDNSPWERYTRAAFAAFQKGDYSEAEWQLLNAIQEAEKFGPKDTRLVSSHTFNLSSRGRNEILISFRTYLHLFSNL